MELPNLTVNEDEEEGKKTITEIYSQAESSEIGSNPDNDNFD
jgi:hypothetical protein